MSYIIVSDNARAARELVAAAKAQGAGDIVAYVFGQEDAAVVSRCGAGSVVAIELADGARKEAAAALLAEKARELGEGAMIFSSSRRMVNLAGAVAAGLGTAPVVDVKELSGAGAKHMLYGGKVAVTEKAIGAWAVVVMQAAAYDPADEGDAACPVECVAVSAEPGVRVRGLKAKQGETVDLTAAKSIVCIGRGVNARDGFERCVALKDALGAEMACTRPVTEMEDAFMPRDSYIGASGLVVKPALYVGIATSGQTQHTMGMYESGKVVVIDKNEGSAFFQQCDYGIVGDYNEIVPAITRALGA